MLISGTFAGEPMTQAEEMNDLADALYNGDTMTVDGDGVVHLDDGTNTVENGATIPQGTFAGEPLSQMEELNDMADALYNEESSGMTVDDEGIVHLTSDVDTVDNGNKGPRIGDGTFAGEPMTQAEEMNDLADALYNGDTMTVDGDDVIHLDDGTNTVENGATIPQGTFAASMPGDPTQWYNKNDHRLFRTEVAAMKKYFPKAGFGFMKSTGNMYWVIDMKVSQSGFAQNWRFMLVYDKNHPHNNSYGGSIKVYPINPNESDIKSKARRFGRPGVPHLLHDTDNKCYLCTRRTEDVKDGTHEANSAVSVAAWAADWALHFEVGIRDKKVWNKWCNDEHFRGLMI